MGLACCHQLVRGRWAGFRPPGGHHVKVFFFEWQMRLILTL